MVVVTDVFDACEGCAQNSLILNLFVECQGEKTLVILWINGSNPHARTKDNQSKLRYVNELFDI